MLKPWKIDSTQTGWNARQTKIARDLAEGLAQGRGTGRAVNRITAEMDFYDLVEELLIPKDPETQTLVKQLYAIIVDEIPSP